MFLGRLILKLLVLAVFVAGFTVPVDAKDVPLPSEKPAVKASVSISSKLGRLLKGGRLKPVQKTVSAPPQALSEKPKSVPLQPTKAIAKLYYLSLIHI